MKPHRDIRTSKRVGDPSSKYGLNPEQFDIDIQEKQKKREEKKQEIKRYLLIHFDNKAFKDDTFRIIIEAVREIKEELRI